MYNIPHSRKNIFVRVVEFFLVSILTIPSIVINLKAISRWDRIMRSAEYLQLRPVRYDIQNILILCIPIIGFFCSLSLIYAIIKKWNIWKVSILAIIVVITTSAYIWYDLTSYII
jgi:hypothetical protein